MSCVCVREKKLGLGDLGQFEMRKRKAKKKKSINQKVETKRILTEGGDETTSERID